MINSSVASLGRWVVWSYLSAWLCSPCSTSMQFAMAYTHPRCRLDAVVLNHAAFQTSLTLEYDSPAAFANDIRRVCMCAPLVGWWGMPGSGQRDGDRLAQL